MRKIKLIALIALLALLLCGSSCRLGIKTLEYDKQSNTYTDGAGGINYLTAPLCYEAAAIAGEYAIWQSGAANISFYGISNTDPREWLTEEGKTVFYSDAVTLPTLDALEVSSAIICVEGDYTVALAEIKQKEEIDKLISLWLEGESCDYPLRQTDTKYRLKFSSEKYYWLYYSLSYIEDGEGGYYLYDRYSRRCVNIGDIVDKYLHDKAE